MKERLTRLLRLAEYNFSCHNVVMKVDTEVYQAILEALPSFSKFCYQVDGNLAEGRFQKTLEFYLHQKTELITHHFDRDLFSPDVVEQELRQLFVHMFPLSERIRQQGLFYEEERSTRIILVLSYLYRWRNEEIAILLGLDQIELLLQLDDRKDNFLEPLREMRV